MKRAAAALVRIAVVAGALVVAPCVAHAGDGPQTLHRARLVAVVDGQALPARTIELPLHWDVEFEGRSGRAELTLEFDLPTGTETARDPHALFISRLGNAYEIELNGVILAGAGSLEDRTDPWSAKHPVRLSFPSRLLADHNVLQVRIRADAGYRAGLAPVVVGPARLVAPIARRAELLRIVLPQATAAFSLLVAAFCALLWWQQREPLYAWAGWGEALWAVTVADTVLETAPLPWPYWGMTLLLLRAAWAWSLYAIAREVFGGRPRLEARTILAIQVAAPLCVLAMAALHSTRPLIAWYVVTFLGWAWVIGALGRQAVRAPSAERWTIVVAVVAVVLASLRDAVAGRGDAALYDESAWAKYVATLVGGALMWIVSRRFLQARGEAARLNASLAGQVEQKERELRASFERLSEVERSRAVLAERERILRDMHDGVGANLATAVRQLESGRAKPQEVVQTLRESMDHLKLSIDAMNLPAGDVNALLASLRYRLQPRIESAGLQVRWNVDELPRWPNASDEGMRHLQFLLLEIISNVLQHAGASTLTLGGRVAEGAIEITLTDDGRGIGSSAAQGLRSLESRALLIGARLSVESVSPGTRVSVSLPHVLADAPG